MNEPEEIDELIERLDDNIRELGWDAFIEGAHTALRWARGYAGTGQMISRAMAKPAAERRQAWIADGGNAADWPEK